MFFFVSLTPLERASATGLSLPGRCSNRSMNSCLSSCHLHSRFEDSVVLAQLVRVVFSVRTFTHWPAKSSGYRRRAETTANSSRSFAGHFCSAGESVFESRASGISFLSWVTSILSGYEYTSQHHIVKHIYRPAPGYYPYFTAGNQPFAAFDCGSGTAARPPPHRKAPRRRPTAGAAFAGKLTSPGVQNSRRTQHSPQGQRLRWQR